MAIELVSDSPERTSLLGELIGRRLAGGTLVLLEGELGAGKTVFAKGLGRGLGVEGEITSPSFNLMLRYHGRSGFDHWDLYRLESISGDEEFLESVYDGASITAVEWGERIADELDVPKLTFRFELLPDKHRRSITIDGDAEVLADMVEPAIEEWERK